jgi:hypothetical protein
MCKRLEYSKVTCDEIYNCCDCGGNDCGCAYCWSCNACEDCLEEV